MICMPFSLCAWQAVQAAVDHQLNSLISSHPHQRVALITFSDEVSIMHQQCTQTDKCVYQIMLTLSCVCVYMYMCMYMQGWESRCPLLYHIHLFVWAMVGWVTLPFLFFLLFF